MTQFLLILHEITPKAFACVNSVRSELNILCKGRYQLKTNLVGQEKKSSANTPTLINQTTHKQVQGEFLGKKTRELIRSLL
ncbi:MAG: hypothetical protein H7A33_01250 [Deltaproteobacteria bacterium]|nr:hypothetical protein [Deltaproteobacteria bacterium]